MSETGDRITRIYGGFRGVDFRGEEINLSRSPDSLNVWKDYRETESIRTRPDMERKVQFSEDVYGIFFYKDMMIVHSGTYLYKVVKGVKTQLYSRVNPVPSSAFVYDSIFYFKDGMHYLKYDGNEIDEVEGYAPTTSIGRKPEGGGTVYEDVNMLSNVRMNTFLGDGESTEYFLDAQDIDPDFKPVVTINGNLETNFTVNYTAGKVKFAKAPPEPLTDGRDNVVIEFHKTVDGHADRILKCKLLQVFDNRVFVSGNDEYPNVLWHCSLNNPSYFSDLDYYEEGLDTARINGIVAGNHALWAFREPSQANTTVFYHTPTIDGTYGKIYPSQHSSITVGCVGKAINFNDDIVFFSERGMEGISGDVTTEQAVAHRSSLVDRKLIAEGGYKDMILVEWEGYLMVIIGKNAYLADSRTAFTNENHIEYEWFYWTFDKEITAARVDGGVLYLGTKDGVYTLTDTESDLVSWWVTPLDKFKAPNKQKTTNKRGCVVEATGDITVYAKVEDTDFEPIGTFEGITDYFACRIKRKKFKDIQLKFYSETRFSLETATLECFIGGYIKR